MSVAQKEGLLASSMSLVKGGTGGRVEGKEVWEGFFFNCADEDIENSSWPGLRLPVWKRLQDLQKCIRLFFFVLFLGQNEKQPREITQWPTTTGVSSLPFLPSFYFFWFFFGLRVGGRPIISLLNSTFNHWIRLSSYIMVSSWQSFLFNSARVHVATGKGLREDCALPIYWMGKGLT